MDNLPELKTYIIVFVIFIHTSIALFLSDNLTGILNDDLVCLKATIATDTVTTIRSLNHFNPNSILATTSPTFL